MDCFNLDHFKTGNLYERTKGSLKWVGIKRVNKCLTSLQFKNYLFHMSIKVLSEVLQGVVFLNSMLNTKSESKLVLEYFNKNAIYLRKNTRVYLE